MDNFILNNFLNPPVLFFFLGIVAAMLKSDLDIPQPISKFLSYYLLICIGLKGGASLAEAGISSQMVTTLLATILSSIVIAVYTFYICKKSLGIYNSAAIAASYGSVSAVTFIAAISFLQDRMIGYNGYMVAAMALMESPPIIVSVFLARRYDKTKPGSHHSMSSLLKEAFFNGSVLLLLGSLLIGTVSGKDSLDGLKPFTHDIFKGMLTFFLLDMGLLAGKRIGSLQKAGWQIWAYALVAPVLHAFAGLAMAWFLGLGAGDAFLISVLLGSASYIAVPAAMRLVFPEANPGLYLPMSLAITFPFSILVGIPLYYNIISWLW